MIARRRVYILASVASISACSHSQQSARVETAAVPRSIDNSTLKEARWSPVANATGDNREVIRVASVLALINRSYVEIVRRGDEITLEVADPVGNRFRRPLASAQWQALVAGAEVLKTPMNDAKATRHLRRVVKQTGYCHGGSQVELVLNGQYTYASPSVCLGPEAKPALSFVDMVNRTALTLFPECGQATDPSEIVTQLSHCPAKLVSTQS